MLFTLMKKRGFFSVLLSWFFNLPHIYDMHSSLPKQLVNFKFGDNKLMISIFEHLEKLVINTCDAMITIGPDLESYVRDKIPEVPMQMIENLPLNIDQDYEEITTEINKRFRSQNGLLIVYTGTFERYQGVDVLIESFEQVVKRYPETSLILVGGKPNQIKKYEDLVSKKNLAGSIQFTGIVSLEDANTYIHLADILVSPRIEGTSVPLKIYTYLNAGKPILATNIPAHSLVLSQDNACLVDPTGESMTAGLVELIEDRELRLKIGVANKKLAEEKYSQAQYLTKLKNIYNAIQNSQQLNTDLSNPTKNR